MPRQGQLRAQKREGHKAKKGKSNKKERNRERKEKEEKRKERNKTKEKQVRPTVFLKVLNIVFKVLFLLTFYKKCPNTK